MGDRNYEIILNSMQKTGVYVIREDDHRILYLNQRVREVTPQAKPGMVCHELWSGSCPSCPLLSIGERQESRSVCYSSPFGQVVDIAAYRMLWDGEIPAFIITLTPHIEASATSYCRLLRIDLHNGCYQVVRQQEQNSWSQERNEPFSAWMERFIRQGRLHPEDAVRLRAFIRPEHLLEGFRAGKKSLTCTYRRWVDGNFRWNLLEAVPDFTYSEADRTILLYDKDVHDVFQEGLEREDSSIRRQELIRALGEQNFSIYVIDLNEGLADPIRVEGQMQPLSRDRLLSWENGLRLQIRDTLHWEYQEEFDRRFSLGSLQRARNDGETRLELLCQRTLDGELYSYISISVCFNQEREHRRYAVLALQDTDDRVRQEMARSQWDMQMAAILKCRYSMMNTVHLDTGLCEHIDLRRSDVIHDSPSDNYEQHVETALRTVVNEADAVRFFRTMALDHIRQKALTTEDYAEEICQYRTKETPPRWLEQHVVYSRHSGEMMVNILGRDITAEKSREAVQQENVQEKLDIIRSLSSMFFSMYYVDLQGDTLQGVTQLRDVEELVGQRAQYSAAIRTYAETFIHPDDREEYLSAMHPANLIGHLSASHPFLAVEYRKLPSSDVESLPDQCDWVRSTAVLVRNDSSGRPLTALYAAQDVTESKQKEAREHSALLEACQAAGNANAAKSDFLSRMSHDIRTPMNGIMGMTNIALSHLDDPERVEDCLRKIVISSRHLLNLVNEVLDMSQIESGRIDLAEERFSISEMIQDLVVILRSPIQEKGHELRVYPLQIEHDAVSGDGSRLRQVFVNILGNSVKYTPPGGLLEIEVREKESRQHGYGCYDFVFRDNGVGMTEEFVQQIFDPYSRAEDSRTSTIEGTGLGMTIAQNIVRMMGGSIAVQSKPGGGSQFTVTIFLRQEDGETAAPLSGGEAPSFQDRRMLLVEDNELNREIACEILLDTGAQVECAGNGKEALDLFLASAPGYYDVILMDIQMPVMNGHEATRAIRGLSRPDAATIPIVAMSANAFAEDIAASREAGMNEHITKPLDIPRLMQCLDHWIGQKEK